MACLLARQEQGLGFGGGKHWSEARSARFRPTLTGPNTNPQSWLAAVTTPTLTCTLTLTLKHQEMKMQMHENHEEMYCGYDSCAAVLPGGGRPFPDPIPSPPPPCSISRLAGSGFKVWGRQALVGSALRALPTHAYRTKH